LDEGDVKEVGGDGWTWSFLIGHAALWYEDRKKVNKMSIT
jgi:hypothetical protein